MLFDVGFVKPDPGVSCNDMRAGKQPDIYQHNRHKHRWRHRCQRTERHRQADGAKEKHPVKPGSAKHRAVTASANLKRQAHVTTGESSSGRVEPGGTNFGGGVN